MFGNICYKMFWDGVHKLNRTVRRSISIPAYTALIVAALIDVTNDFSDNVLVCISVMWFVCQSSRFCFSVVCYFAFCGVYCDNGYCFEVTLCALHGL